MHKQWDAWQHTTIPSRYYTCSKNSVLQFSIYSVLWSFFSVLWFSIYSVLRIRSTVPVPSWVVNRPFVVRRDLTVSNYLSQQYVNTPWHSQLTIFIFRQIYKILLFLTFWNLFSECEIVSFYRLSFKENKRQHKEEFVLYQHLFRTSDCQ